MIQVIIAILIFVATVFLSIGISSLIRMIEIKNSAFIEAVTTVFVFLFAILIIGFLVSTFYTAAGILMSYF